MNKNFIFIVKMIFITFFNAKTNFKYLFGLNITLQTFNKFEIIYF